MASEASAAALQMRADLAAGRMSMSEYARQARAAGETIGAVAAVLKEHAASAKPTATQAEAAGPAEASAETIPAGTYFGRTHGGPVHVVDGRIPKSTIAVNPATYTGGVRSVGGRSPGDIAELRDVSKLKVIAIPDRMKQHTLCLFFFDVERTGEGGTAYGLTSIHLW